MIKILPKFRAAGNVFYIFISAFLLSTSYGYGQNFAEMIKAVASDRAAGDYFAYDVAVSDDYAVVGSPQDDEDEVGANTFSTSGSAYIFKRDGYNWSQIQKIVPSDRSPGDQFGWSVAISGNYIVVGAYQEDHDVNGINTKNGAGSAYVFERNDDDVWVETQKIIASDRAPFDFFGYSVAISGDHLISGAYYEDEDVNGGNTLNTAGSAYIFERDSDGVWNEVSKIVASDRALSDFFGRSVAISGDYAIVGSYYEDEDVNGGNTLSSAGSAYIFERDNLGNWTEKQKLVSSDRAINDFFGISVSIAGDFAIVGAHYDDTSADHIDTGAAYIYKRNNAGSWNQTQKLVSSDKDTKDYFGKSVSISDDYLVVGAHYEDEDISGNNNLNISGAAYIFEKNEFDNWSQIHKIVASDRAAGDRFGSSVAISGKNIIVGSYLEDQDINNSNTLSASGSAYIFMKDEVLITEAIKESNTQINISFNVNVQTGGTNPGDFIINDGNGSFFPVLAQSDGIPGDNMIELTVSNLSTAANALNLYYINNNDEIQNLSGSAIMETDLTGIPVGAAFTTTYTDGAWSNGVPNASFITIINDNFVSTSDLICYNLKVNSGKSFYLNGHRADISSDFVLENGASFLDEGVLNAGTSTLKRTTSSTSLSQFHLLSSPISNGNIEDSFQGSYAYRYIGGEYDNIYAFNNGAKIVNGEGLAISGTSAGVVNRSYSGAFNNKDIDYDLISTDQWHLLGNPYPVQLDLNAFYNENISSIKPTFYFYNENTGAYDTWNTELNFGTGSVTGNVAITQGFFAVEQNSSAAQVSFTKDMRTMATDIFLKTSAGENSGKLKLKMNGAETLIAWSENASNEEDINDAPYLQGTATKGIYSLQNDALYTIQTIHNDFHSTIVPLGYYQYESGLNSISIEHFNASTDVDVILVDRYNNSTHDLHTAPYEFTTVGSDEMINDRFDLIIINKSLSVQEDQKDNSIRILSGEILELISTDESLIQEVNIHSMNGRLVYQKTNINSNNFQWKNQRSKGFYLLSIQTENKTSHHKILMP